MKYFPDFSIIYWRWSLSMARVFGLKASRLSKDYEYLAESSEAFIRIMMIRLTPARLT
jgi:hypothetical protein